MFRKVPNQSASGRRDSVNSEGVLA